MVDKIIKHLSYTQSINIKVEKIHFMCPWLKIKTQEMYAPVWFHRVLSYRVKFDNFVSKRDLDLAVGLGRLFRVEFVAEEE